MRHHGDLARIEVLPGDFSEILRKEMSANIISQLQALGFDHISLDLEGYTQGSMNKGISVDPTIAKA